ncbi:hypothetical protein NEUTE2DRAFT_62498 [Neurospora tetrasperma FGSC 2509]|nr:hypothetical protein NEUTE2DRAFT_62498 [Neurospora tetrasperma FGSC 2509]
MFVYFAVDFQPRKVVSLENIGGRAGQAGRTDEWVWPSTYRERLMDAQLQVHLTTVKPSNKRAI